MGWVCAEGWSRRLGRWDGKEDPIPGSITSFLPDLGQALGHQIFR